MRCVGVDWHSIRKEMLPRRLGVLKLVVNLCCEMCNSFVSLIGMQLEEGEEKHE